jgi:hypothetical protein
MSFSLEQWFPHRDHRRARTAFEQSNSTIRGTTVSRTPQNATCRIEFHHLKYNVSIRI